MPKAITRSAVILAALVLGPLTAADAPPIKALLVLGGCCHDYAKQQEIITKGISERFNVSWRISYDPDKGSKHLNPIYERPDWAAGYDIIVHDECSAEVKDLAVIERILKPHKDGLPGVVLHCAMHCFRSEGYPAAITPWFAFTGLQSTGHGAQLPIAITYTAKEHPITAGLVDWTTVNEELYNNSAGKLLDTAKELARGKQGAKGGEPVIAWTNTYNGKAKVFGTTVGHNNATVGDARYLDLIGRGLLWAVDKLDDANRKPAKQVMLDGP